MKQTMSMLVSGDSKVGKSTLLATSPGHKLVLDAEGSWAYMHGRPNPNNNGEPYRVIEWDPSQPPPERGDWDICMVNTFEWSVVDQVIQWITRHDHPFDSMGMDSVTEVQDRCKKALTGIEGLRTQDWGVLLAHMSDRVKKFRDAIKDPKNPAHCMVFVAESKLRDGKYRPHMQGAIKDSISYWMNSCAYLKVAQVADNDGNVSEGSRKIRRLLIGAHPDYVTGSHFEDRFDNGIIDEPNIQTMMETIFPGFSVG